MGTLLLLNLRLLTVEDDLLLILREDPTARKLLPLLPRSAAIKPSSPGTSEECERGPQFDIFLRIRSRITLIYMTIEDDEGNRLPSLSLLENSG